VPVARPQRAPPAPNSEGRPPAGLGARGAQWGAQEAVDICGPCAFAGGQRGAADSPRAACNKSQGGHFRGGPFALAARTEERAPSSQVDARGGGRAGSDGSGHFLAAGGRKCGFGGAASCELRVVAGNCREFWLSCG